MNLHILGICGTFMGGVALLARQLGHRVTGQDSGVYPPMSTQLEQQGIELIEGYDPTAIPEDVDLVVIGNALSRGNPAVEFILDRRIPYTSGPQWLEEHLLQQRWVIAVAGTHGKTTTSSMVAHILEQCGMSPGFLIGGVPKGLGLSARLGEDPFFVVEADEYDTAFFDKRSKFVHYHPQTLVLNNLEFDHADIFPDLAAIQRQFHHLIRTVPGGGKIVSASGVAALDEVIDMGCWTPVEALGAANGWQAHLLDEDGSRFEVLWQGELKGVVEWSLLGKHNVSNGLAAIAATHHAGMALSDIISALSDFKGVQRRLELRGEVKGVRVYDDFAHHPTAIASTLAGVRAHVGEGRVIAVLEPRSNTMRMGVHASTLLPALQDADMTHIYNGDGVGWIDGLDVNGAIYHDLNQMVSVISTQAQSGDHIVIMSNGGFGGIHQRLLEAL